MVMLCIEYEDVLLISTAQHRSYISQDLK